MSAFKRGNVWWFEFSLRGARIRESSHSKVRAVADRLERERRRGLELGTGGLKKLSGPLSVTRAVEAYRKLREPHWAKRTRGIQASSWKHLEPVFGKLLLSDISPQTISKYQRQRQREEASGRTINIEVGLIRQVMIHHRMWHAIAPDVKMLRERQDVGRALTADEEFSVLAGAKKSTSRSLYPAVLLSIHSGMRNEELRLLQWRQVDFLQEQIQVGKSKTSGGEGRIIPLSDTALDCLKEWRSRFPDGKPEDYVFPTERYGLHGKKGAFGGEVKYMNTTRKRRLQGGRLRGLLAANWRASPAAGTICDTPSYRGWEKTKSRIKPCWRWQANYRGRCWSGTATRGTNRSEPRSNYSTCPQ
jgi:integrase